MGYTFKDWLISENRDIFGFERPKNNNAPKATNDLPILAINSEMLIESMLKTNLNGQEPFSEFPDQIQWGQNPGAMRMVISPLGSFKSIIRKLMLNLEGKEVWACKKIIPYNDIMNATPSFDEKLAMDLFENIEEIYKQDIEAPSREYNKLERLTLAVARTAQRRDVIPEIFIYRGIKQIKKDENYIIYFECKGQGVEAPGSARLEQFIIDMSYNKNTGMIRSFGHDVQSPIRGHLWYSQPSEWDEYFSAGQSDKEIAMAIGQALSTY
jgi:hypothetical protein